jgi:hypothetical protein
MIIINQLQAINIDQWFDIALIFIAIWLVLATLLFNRVHRRHPRTFELMGAPSITRPDPQALIEGAQLIFTTKHKTLGDTSLSSLVWSMRLVAAICVVTMAFLVFWVVREFA